MIIIGTCKPFQDNQQILSGTLSGGVLGPVGMSERSGFELVSCQNASGRAPTQVFLYILDPKGQVPLHYLHGPQSHDMQIPLRPKYVPKTVDPLGE